MFAAWVENFENLIRTTNACGMFHHILMNLNFQISKLYYSRRYIKIFLNRYDRIKNIVAETKIA